MSKIKDYYIDELLEVDDSQAYKQIELDKLRTENENIRNANQDRTSPAKRTEANHVCS